MISVFAIMISVMIIYTFLYPDKKYSLEDTLVSKSPGLEILVYLKSFLDREMGIYYQKYVHHSKDRSNTKLVFFSAPLAFFTASIRLCLFFGCLFFEPGSLKNTSSPSSVTTICFFSTPFFFDPSGALLGAA